MNPLSSNEDKEKKNYLFKISKNQQNIRKEIPSIQPLRDQEIGMPIQNSNDENKIDANPVFMNLPEKVESKNELDPKNISNQDLVQHLDTIKEQKFDFEVDSIKKNNEGKNINRQILKNDNGKKFCKQMNCPCKLVNNEKSLQIKNSENGVIKSTLIIQKLEENAILFASKQDFSSTIKHYEKILILDNNNLNALEQIGHLYLMSNNLLKAREFYIKSLELSKKPSKQLLFGLGIINEKNVNFEESLIMYLKSLSFTETNLEKYDLWDKIGEILIKIANFDSAIQIFEFCLQFYDLPDECKLNILLKLGNANMEKAYEGKTNYQTAIDYFVRANYIASNLRVDVLCYLAWGYLKQKDYENCDNILNEISKISPTNPDLLYIKSRLEFEFQKIKEAEQILDQAISINSKNSLYFCTKCIYEIFSGKYNESFISLLNALSVDKNYYEAWYNLGLLYEFFLHPSDAIFAYQKCINICKGFNLAIERMASLKKNNNFKIIETKERILNNLINPEFRINNSLYPLKGYSIHNRMNGIIQFYLNYPQKITSLNNELYSYYPSIPFSFFNSNLNDVSMLCQDNNSFYFLYPGCMNPYSINYSYPWGNNERFVQRNHNSENNFEGYKLEQNSKKHQKIKNSEIIESKNNENNQEYSINHLKYNFHKNPFLPQKDEPLTKNNIQQNAISNPKLKKFSRIKKKKHSNIHVFSEKQKNDEVLIKFDNSSKIQEERILNPEISYLNSSKHSKKFHQTQNHGEKDIEQLDNNKKIKINDQNDPKYEINVVESKININDEEIQFQNADNNLNNNPEIFLNVKNVNKDEEKDIKKETSKENYILNQGNSGDKLNQIGRNSEEVSII